MTSAETGRRAGVASGTTPPRSRWRVGVEVNKRVVGDLILPARNWSRQQESERVAAGIT